MKLKYPSSKWFVLAVLLSPDAVRSQTPLQEVAFTAEQSAAARRDPAAYTIDEESASIERIGVSSEPAGGQPLQDAPGDKLVIIDKIINIAQKIWTIIEKNKPVVDVQNQYAAAVPSGITHWTQLGGWKPPQGEVYRLTFKNLYGMKVVDVRFSVLRSYGGSYNGKGRYLTAVTIEPLAVDVLWAYKFTLSTEVPDTGIFNVGSAADPVAGMLVNVKWRVQTPINDTQGKGIYYVQGDGVFKEVGGPFRRVFSERVSKVLAGAGTGAFSR